VLCNLSHLSFFGPYEHKKQMNMLFVFFLSPHRTSMPYMTYVKTMEVLKDLFLKNLLDDLGEPFRSN
jgi:hypothetical protein